MMIVNESCMNNMIGVSSEGREMVNPGQKIEQMESRILIFKYNTHFCKAQKPAIYGESVLQISLYYTN